MFKLNDNHFSKVNCPNHRAGHTCDILNCLFRHPEPASGATKRSINDEETGFSDNKRQNVSTSDDVLVILPRPVTHIEIPRPERVVNIKRIANTLTTATPQRDAIAKELEIAGQSESHDQYTQKVDLLLNPDKPVPQDPEFVLPKHMISPPATIQVRKQNILELVKAITQMNPTFETPKLKAIDLEFSIASSTSKHTYMHSIKRKIYEIKNPAKLQTRTKELTDDDWYRELAALVISLDTLKKYGYITEPPEPQTPAATQKCRRCGHEFELAKQMTPIHCAYHSGKSAKRDRKRVYGCCGAEVGDNESSPCTSSSHHVFGWETAGEKHHFLPFQYTHDIYKPSPTAYKAIGIDCEMGYTTQGFELLRITAMDFFSGEEVLDVLVKPLGEVVDLNTRWSGIAEIKADALSFADSVRTVGEIMDPNTILIGHGLENDLNAMRLIHHRVVDTAILYPKLQTSPTFRFPLKYLTFKYLGRKIQGGEHDSGEDALAAIDVVKYFIKKDYR
ncbi:RNA exonuclease 3 [Yamadazyma tenuis]|uniref:RNA exonuclease 3 n=1 Tax=Candida tenuis (strain ATCC 10573 / BCRC 21748 / CBS 615 / JCM 9827 / NBRC 10315 / NRRL Y-1498 / VKM Y-70) TaxID=590646 RepID=G3BAM9_CANTC|nr:ribonuclease H-like protein [Yamadazyma tenuis ATCC 10573]EGV61447.1 ribonuclease H-like protein [Yamadazyma tenuis ATCC 10573]WEJ92661.1 RNA exonuclease 3 [Yamadazyma tenuis]